MCKKLIMMNWEIGIDIYTLICIKWITNKNLLYKKINKIKFKKIIKINLIKSNLRVCFNDETGKDFTEEITLNMVPED